MQEMLLFLLNTDDFLLILKTERIDCIKITLLEIVLRLFVHKRTHLTGQATYPFPFPQRFLNGDLIALPLPPCSLFRIEGLEEIGNQRTHWQ